MIEKLIKEYTAEGAFDRIGADEAMNEKYVGLKIFDEPLIGYASADDELFDEYVNREEILSCRFMHPKKWLPEAKTVVSAFFPFTDEVKKSNAADMATPSDEWQHARYEGQNHLNNMTQHIRDGLIEAGYKCVAAALDSRYKVSFVEREKKNSDYGGNWSERHAAYAAGLGTFGLSKGLITKRGVAGRFLSVITDMQATPTARDYSGIYDYCNMCGLCIGNCPAGAISFERGKQHVSCHEFLKTVLSEERPKYACGKCQIAVPCMSAAPKLTDNM